MTIFLSLFFYNEYGDIMRKYYLFIINNDYYKNYKKNPKVLYNTLYNLYALDKKNFTYGISLYNSVCQVVSKNLLIHYIQRKYHHKHKTDNLIRLLSQTETTIVQINHSCIVVVSSINMPEVFKTFYIYHKKIFVCDFQNEDYFWLSDQIQKVR